MRIIQLNLYGFGKFEDDRIDLLPGLNLLYGPNESGKSTLHSFIHGIFYGFLKPYSKRTIYTNDHKKYLPWSGSNYSGSIVFEEKGEVYRIDRVFTKGHEKTKIFMEKTGEDITGKFQEMDNSKVLQPGEYFFGINSSVFKNTLFIGQNDIRPDRNLADEVREKLVNASTGGDERISVEKALGFLEEQLREIGTKRATTSEYGKVTALIENTKDRLRIVEEQVNRYNEHLFTYKDLNGRLGEIADKKTELEEKLKSIEILEKIHIYNEIINLREKNRSLGKELEITSQHKDKDEEDLDRAIKLNEEIQIQESRIKSFVDRRDEIKTKENRISQSHTDSIYDLDEVLEDEEKFKEMDYLTHGIKDHSILENNIQNHSKNRKRIMVLLTFLVLIYFAFGIYSVSENNILFGVMIQFIAAMIIYGIIKLRHITRERDKARKDIKVVYEKIKILQKYQMENREDLIEFVEKIKSQKTRIEQNRLYLMEIQEEKNHLNNRIKSHSSEINTLRKKLGSILESNNVEDILSLKSGLREKARFSEVKKEIEYNRSTIERLLKNYDMDHLRENFHDNIEESIEVNIDDKDFLKKSFLEREEEERQLKMKLNETIGSLSELEESVEEDFNLREKLAKLNDEENRLRNKREALEMARDRIISISATMHKEYAPNINNTIGDLMSTVTGGKYSSAKVDKNLSLGLVESISGRLVKFDDLSTATLDQLYLGLRMGILDELVSKDLPLVLDESFSNYDDQRLRRIIKYIIENERDQIILFSSHKREEQILDELGKDYNKIYLQQV